MNDREKISSDCTQQCWLFTPRFSLATAFGSLCCECESDESDIWEKMLVPARICAETAVRNELHRGASSEGAWILIWRRAWDKKVSGYVFGPLPVTVSPRRVARWRDSLTMHVVSTQVWAHIMMTLLLWGIKCVGRQQQPGRTSLPAMPHRAARNGLE